MWQSFLAIFPVFLLIFSGYWIKKKFVQEESFWKTADQLTYYLFFPSLLVLKISGTDFGDSFPKEAVYASVMATFLMAVVLLLAKPLLNVENSLFTSIFQGGVRYNSYIFIAMSAALLGEEGVAMSGVFISYMIILTNFLSVLVLNHYGQDQQTKNLGRLIITLFKNPLIFSALFGLSLNYLHIKIHTSAADYLHYLGAAATPMSLLSVGAGLSFVMEWAKIKAILCAIACKLIVMPFFVWFFLQYFAVTQSAAAIALLYGSVPCAGNAYILARQMGGDAKAMAAIITWTTLLSCLSISLWVGL